MKTRSSKWYGWVPDFPDHRDYKFERTIHPKDVPPFVDLRQLCPAVVDQGQLGSCTANAIAGVHEFEQMRQGRKIYKPDGAKRHNPLDYAFAPSRLFIYYNERKMEGTITEDSGAQLRDGIKTLNLFGVCTSKTWPYHVPKFADEPPSEAYTEAKVRGTTLQYHSIGTSLEDKLACLAQQMPFVFGFTVYESFESGRVARTGEVPMPRRNESVLGGHAVMAVGYDTHKKVFIVRNSWGNDWGLSGYCTMPFSYLNDPNLADDFWVITQVV